MPSGGADDETSTNHNIVHEVYGSLNELTSRLVTENNLALLTTDLKEWMQVLKEKIFLICPTRANLIRFCMELTQKTNKTLYTAYVAASKAADANYYSSTAFNDAQLSIGGFIVELMEKHKSSIAATLNAIYSLGNYRQQ